MLQKRDIKRTWRIINNIINTKNRKVENTVKKIIHDDVIHEDSGDIANMFNEYFVDIGRNIAESIGGSNANHLDYMTHINQPVLTVPVLTQAGKKEIKLIVYSLFQTNSLLFH